jgi:hypothetical protein
MAKIYGTPLMMGGSGGANKDLPPLLDNFKAIKGGGTKLKDLPNGTKVKFGSHNDQTLVWRIAQDEGVTKAVLDLDYDTGKTVIGDMIVSPANSICGNWAITGWLNATEEGGSWWANRVKYSDDPAETEPTYSSKDGFLHGWSETDRGLLQSIEWGCDDFLQGGFPEPYQLNCKLMICSEDEAYAAWNGERFCVGFGDTPVILRDYSIGADGYSGISGMGSSTMEGAVSKSGLSNAIGIWPVCAPNPEAVVSATTDDDGCYTIDYDAFYVTIQADKMEESRAKELAGAVWVYGDHIPKNVNDGTKIQLTREEIVRPDGEPYITLNDVPASDAEIETIINIKESDGQLHPYIYLSNDYEGSGAGLLLRKDIYQKGQFHSSSHQYNGSIVDAWCEGTFLTTVLDTYVQEQLMSVNIQVQGAYISRKCFVLSIVEYNWSASGISEGNSLPYFKDNKARISLYQGSSADYYTRTYQSSNGNIWFVGLMGNAGPTPATTNLGYRPAVCIKKSFKIKSTPNEDGSYDMYDDASTVSTFASSEFIVEKSVSWEQTKNFYNSKKQYQTMLEGAIAKIYSGQRITELPSGSKVKLGTWEDTPLQWKVARDTSDQSIRLVLEPTSVSLLGNKMYDNKEPSNSDIDRRNYGNNRYIYSNIHQWLNATKATGWYTAQHSTDAAPDYSSQAGFLSGWSENHIAALDWATLTVSRSSIDGGGTETFAARVALISTTELGLQSGTGGGRLDIFNSIGDRSTGGIYWTRTHYRSDSYNAYRVAADGALNNYGGNVLHAYGVRPLCIPKSTTYVSLQLDSDGCYTITGVNE